MVARREFLRVAGLLGASAWARSAFPQQYPSKPIRLVMPSSSGTTIDLTGRFFAEAMTKSLKTPVMVDNRAGAGGLIGSDIVAKAPGDGYTLLIIGVPHFTARWYVDGPIPFDPIKDFAPLAKMCNSALCFVVKADSPYKTLTDLVAAMRQKPGEITYSSGGGWKHLTSLHGGAKQHDQHPRQACTLQGKHAGGDGRYRRPSRLYLPRRTRCPANGQSWQASRPGCDRPGAPARDSRCSDGSSDGNRWL